MKTNVESLAELFFSRLKTTTNAGLTLGQFYAALFNIQCGRTEVIAMNRLIKVFGRYYVFFAIIDISKYQKFDEFPFGLLHKICKDKLFATTRSDVSMSALSNLDKMVADLEKDISMVKEMDLETANKYLEKGA